METAKPTPNPFSPKPKEPGMRVRLQGDGPWIDLGVTHSELLVGILNTLDLICVQTGAGMDDRLRTALGSLGVHRPRGGA